MMKTSPSSLADASLATCWSRAGVRSWSATEAATTWAWAAESASTSAFTRSLTLAESGTSRATITTSSV